MHFLPMLVNPMRLVLLLRNKECYITDQFWCLVTDYHGQMKHIPMRDLHRERMIRTPFRVLIDIPPIPMDGLLINTIITLYCNNDKCFIIGGRRLQFMVDDVAMIFGLRNDGWKVELIGHVWRGSYLEQKYFSTSPDLSRDNLK